jgi:hypothetical protein
VAATHGRSFWVVDIAALEQLTPAIVAADAHLFQPPTAWQFADVPIEGQSAGHQVFAAPSPPYGATITYRLATRQAGLRIAILDATGDTIQTVNAPGNPGINRVAWGFQGKPAPRAALSAAQKRDSALQMQRIVFVLDSLQAAEANQMMLGVVRNLATTGDLTPLMALFGGGGGGTTAGFGPPPSFNPRPGEQSVAGRGGAAGRAGAAGRGGAAGAGAPAGRAGGGGGGADIPTFMSMIEAFRIPGRGGAGGFAALNFLGTLGFSTNFGGAGGSAGAVLSGDYVASLTVGGKTLRQVIRVERGPVSGALSSPPMP